MKKPVEHRPPDSAEYLSGAMPKYADGIFTVGGRQVDANKLEPIDLQESKEEAMATQQSADRWYRVEEAAQARRVAPNSAEFIRFQARERVLRRQLEEREVSTKERATLEARGHAMKGGRYPIAHGADLQAAVKAFGRGNPPDKAAIKAHIKKRAKDLGLHDQLPEDWQDPGYEGTKKGNPNT